MLKENLIHQQQRAATQHPRLTSLRSGTIRYSATSQQTQRLRAPLIRDTKQISLAPKSL